MIRQLIWKECREHQWKVVALLAMLLLPLLAMIWWNSWTSARIYSEDFFLIVPFAGSWLVPIWLGAWLSTGERAQGTHGLLMGLPVSRWAVFAVKSIWGLVAILGPLLVALICIGERTRMVAIPISAASLYLMIAAITAGIRKEGLAAMVGLLVVLACGFWAAVAGELESPGATALAMVGNPFLAEWCAEPPRSAMGMPTVFALQGVLGVLWWVVAGWRFSRQGQGGHADAGHRAGPSRALFVGPRGFLFGPMLWREYREQRWVVVGAALASLAIAGIGAIVDRAAERGAATGVQSLETFVALLIFLTGLSPTIIGLVLAVGSMAGDMEPRLMNFWRSRPMRTGSLFWSKYLIALSGIGVLLGVLLGATLVGSGVIALTYHSVAEGAQGDGLIMLVAMTGWLPLVLTLTMFLYVLLRRAIYVLALAVTMLATIFINVSTWVSEHTRGADSGLALMHALLALAAAGIAVSVGLAVLTWLALQRDWHIGGRAG